MDADAFDHAMSFKRSAYANEMRVYDSLMEGYADVLKGDVLEAAEAEASIRVAKGWA